MESNVTPTDSAALFARDLRALRFAAGNPTLRALSGTTRLSTTVISDALGGRRLPTEHTVDRLVGVLGGDSAAWVARRNLVAAPADGVGLCASESGECGEERAELAPGRHRTRGLALTGLAVVCAVIAVGLAAPILNKSRTPERQDRQLTAPLPVTNRADPELTICIEDATVLASAVLAEGAFRADLLFSAECDAAWGRVEAVDGVAPAAVLFPASDRYGGRTARAQFRDGQAAHTTLLVGFSNLPEGVCLELQPDGFEAELPETERTLCAVSPDADPAAGAGR